MMEYQFRPLEHWPGERTPCEILRSRYTFKASYAKTLAMLEKELRHLDAKAIVIQCDIDASKIRIDGMIKGNSVPNSPGIILSFDSKHGPLSYPCDSCEKWEHNLRSIALALVALRKVDLYGVTRRAEQYRGWSRLPAPGVLTDFSSIDAAKDFIADLVGVVEWREPYQTNSIRKAKTMAHPDNGGTVRQFKLVTAAAEMIGVAI